MKTSSTLAIVVFASVSCTMGYSNDSRYLGWVNRTEEKCTSQYGPLPLNTPERRDEFLTLGYQTYYGQLSRTVFSSQLGLRYPNHLLHIDCVANSFPRPKSD